MNASNDIQIRDCIGKILEGLHAKDLAVIEQAYTKDVISFDVEPPLHHVGVAAKLANWARVFDLFDTVGYELRDLGFTIGDDVAFGHGFARLSGTTTAGAVIPGMWVRVTYGLRRIDGTWLISHDQVSVPFDVATGRGVTDLEP
ncbi:nuclear transport factor 2 family protein [Nocardia sp. 2]|uniref:Nuclear transport factor 2 family protein n=1 Tax=Nocardia acididurans TaxID=2802282 RepID=A0ABS1M703_9NOCA|nr:nuclear transport factor 2 family protein [Nocardia acididurans]MBL1075994.1 nuclear transport factor 2 family protein [Nocardia acididurans]